MDEPIKRIVKLIIVEAKDRVNTGKNKDIVGVIHTVQMDVLQGVLKIMGHIREQEKKALGPKGGEEIDTDFDDSM